VGAADPIVMVPVDETPPTTDVGLRDSAVGIGAVIVRVAVLDVLLAVAVIVELVLAETAVVVTANVAVVAPDATVTVEGAVADELLLESETEKPPVGAADPIVTVPVEEVPPATDVGLSESAVGTGAVIVRVAVWDVLLAVAVIVELVLVETAVVVAVNVAVVAPEATVTELGTTAEVELLVRLTDSPPEGAALEIVTVPVEEAPPATEVGLKLTLLGVGAVIVRVAVLVPLRFAVIVALVLVATAVVVTVNVAVVA